MRLLWFNLVTDTEDPILGFATRWIDAVARRVTSIRVITGCAGRVEAPGNVTVHSLGKEKGYSKTRRLLELYGRLGKVLRAERIDACFSHMTAHFTAAAGPFLRLHRVPIVTWYAHRHAPWSLLLAHRLSARMVSIGESSYPYLGDRPVLLGHGIDMERFSPGGGPPREGPLVLYVGRISPIKGIETLLEAIRLVRQRHANVRCAIVGDAPERDREYDRRVRQGVEALGIADAVTFVGAAPQTEVVGWYRRCTVAVNMSPKGALDKSVLEGMACGRPSVAANDGFRETMGPWADGLLFRHGDAAHLADRLRRLLDLSKGGRATMGAELRDRAAARHGLEGLADRLVAVLEEVRRP